MKQILVILVAAAFIPFNNVRAFKAAPVERIPSNDLGNAYPRLMHYTNIEPGIDTSRGYPEMLQLASNPSVAIDQLNHAHFAYTSGGSIQYSNSWYQSRRANGLSAPVVLDAGGAFDFPNHADIWVHTDDTVRVAWERRTETGNLGGYTNILLGTKTAAGWQANVNLTGAASGENYFRPQVIVDSSGLVNVVAGKEVSGGTTAWLITWNGSTSTQTQIPGARPDNGTALRFALNSTTVTVVWEEGGAVRKNTRTSGTWGSVVSFGGTGTNIGPDVAMDGAGTTYAAWVRSSDTPRKVYYSVNFGTPAQVSTVASPGTMEWARIGTDSRGQPWVLWDGLSLGAQVKNPDPNTLNTTWRNQEPAVVHGQGPARTMPSPREIAFSRNDEIYVVGGGVYTRTAALRRGMQDAPGMLSVFGGAHANVTNGNLYLPLLLFDAAGQGPNIEALLHYNSLQAEQRGAAPSWSLSCQVKLETDLLGRFTVGNPQTEYVSHTVPPAFSSSAPQARSPTNAAPPPLSPPRRSAWRPSTS